MEEETVESSVVELEEPQDYWEKEEVANQIAKFDQGKGDDIPMLVAVRIRPLWDKARAAPAQDALLLFLLFPARRAIERESPFFSSGVARERESVSHVRGGA